MRYIFSIIVLAVLVSACKKDKFTTVPQIKFNSFSPNIGFSNSTNPIGPMLNFQLTDLEGDFGFNDNKDTSYVYIKNLTISPFNLDSVKFPILPNLGKNLNAEITVNMRNVLKGSGIAHRTDTLFFEVYVKDFAKNKSNVIKTDAFYLVNP